MPVSKILREKIMPSVRKQYPRYSLERRKKIVNAIIYNKLRR